MKTNYLDGVSGLLLLTEGMFRKDNTNIVPQRYVTTIKINNFYIKNILYVCFFTISDHLSRRWKYLWRFLPRRCRDSVDTKSPPNGQQKELYKVR